MLGSLFYGLKSCNFIKKETPAQMFSCEICEISKTPFLQNTSRRLLLCILLICRSVHEICFTIFSIFKKYFLVTFFSFVLFNKLYNECKYVNILRVLTKTRSDLKRPTTSKKRPETTYNEQETT